MSVSDFTAIALLFSYVNIVSGGRVVSVIRILLWLICLSIDRLVFTFLPPIVVDEFKQRDSIKLNV